MNRLFIVLTIMALFAGMASAKLNAGTPAVDFDGPSRVNEVFWFDDIEGDVSGWSTLDLSAGASPHFHWDTYMAFSVLASSWWCGNFDYDLDGGYGNSWDDRLVIPALDLSVATYPILTYAFRHDSEIGVRLHVRPGREHGCLRQPEPWLRWHGAVDRHRHLRFRSCPVRQPAPWPASASSRTAPGSDEDGLYPSVGGGFACDNVKVFDYFSGQVFFYDDEPGADECLAEVPGAAGDFWHVIDRACPAFSDPHSWWCGDDADTSLVPPNLQDALFSPTR